MKTRYLFLVTILTLTSCSPATNTPLPPQTPTTVVPTLTIDSSTSTPDLSISDVWIPPAKMLTARSEMPAVELNGLIYVPGGFGIVAGGLANGKGPVATLEVYDPATDQWRALAPMPDRRHHEMVTVYKNKIY